MPSINPTFCPSKVGAAITKVEGRTESPLSLEPVPSVVKAEYA